MTPTFLLRRIVPIACAVTTASCAVSPPTSGVAPPRLALPILSQTPCVLPRLPDRPTQADLEIAYADRGAALVGCDAARGLAVETLTAERALQDRWLAMQRQLKRPWWRPF